MINAYILAIDTHSHTAALFEPEQDHSDDCSESEESPDRSMCFCPVGGYDLLAFGSVKDQVTREGYARQAAEGAGGNQHDETCFMHEEWDGPEPEETDECECDLSPWMPVLVVTDEMPDLLTWGRWLAELEHVQVDDILQVPYTRLFDALGNANEMARERLVGMPPMGLESAFALYMGQWAQTAPEAFSAVQGEDSKATIVPAAE